MRILPCFLALPSVLLAASLAGCAPSVDVPGDQGATSGAGGSSAVSGTSGASSGGGGSYQGVPCKYLQGQATLTSYTNANDYASSAYSFELATQDASVTNNDWDVMYEADTFTVDTVVDDASFIVDLGDVPLTGVPATVDPAGFPTGQFGMHDDLQAVVSHTYVVRTIDNDTKQWAAFRVVSLAPGASVTLAWIRSPDPDALEVPVGCGP